MDDELLEPHKAQFAAAPGQARKTATVEDSMAAAVELKNSAAAARRASRTRRAAISSRGKMALPPDQR
jgi:hypothetical protein